MHHDIATIQADYELSERLGREIEEAGFEPLPSDNKVQAVLHHTEMTVWRDEILFRTGVDNG